VVEAVAVDGQGVVYVTDYFGHAVVQLTPSSTPPTSTTSWSATSLPGPGGSWTNPSAVALDPSGNLFVADGTTQSIYELPSATAAKPSDWVTLEQAIFSFPPSVAGLGLTEMGLAADGAGHLYVTEANDVRMLTSSLRTANAKSKGQ